MSSIHPTSVVDPGARLGSHISVGPFCVIERGVTVGDGCRIESRVTIREGTVLGPNNYLSEGVVLGGLPQHKSPPERTGGLRLGEGNVIRENVTIHRALAAKAETLIGDNNLLMVNAHVAHDCVLGNEVVLANNVLLAGHITVGDRAYFSGAAGVHQFCRIGGYAMVGGQAHITKDVPPFVMVDGVSSMVVGLNRVGLRRGGVGAEDMATLKSAYRVVFRSGLRWEESLEVMRREYPSGMASQFWRFMQDTERGCVKERVTPRAATLKIHRAAA